ncbi:RNA polymerase sigma factor [Hoylesella pleuritidis]|jgi:RNA polymerase sigma factor, sigma-70 family|uniref:RNA polymerase sigma factor n=1 Tax=Hoylesella pleuritidis TaxID=407975 RepID=UPI00040C3E5B|nr:sigma-70 family RNA polymerase sigma factor [Hoylesella pleuritidis]
MIRGKTARTGSVFLEREFATFFKENYSRLYYYALHFIPDPEVCKDIVSDSFHFMWERIADFKKETALTYMYTHVCHLCIDHIRKAKIRKNHIHSYLSLIQEQNSDAHQESEERIKMIMAIIDKLPPLTQKVMELCYIEKKRYRETAEILGLSESGVRKHIMKGLDTIRKHFSVRYKKGGY